MMMMTTTLRENEAIPEKFKSSYGNQGHRCVALMDAADTINAKDGVMQNKRTSLI